MKVRLVLDIEVTEADYLNQHDDFTDPVTEDVLKQYIEDELGFCASSFTTIDVNELTILPSVL